MSENSIQEANNDLGNKNQCPKLIKLSIVGKFDDGYCRNILIDKATENIVIDALLHYKKFFLVDSKIIESIDIVDAKT